MLILFFITNPNLLFSASKIVSPFPPLERQMIVKLFTTFKLVITAEKKGNRAMMTGLETRKLGSMEEDERDGVALLNYKLLPYTIPSSYIQARNLLLEFNFSFVMV